MTGLYLFAAAAGVPLVAWFLLSGGEESGEGGGGEGGGGEGGEGGADDGIGGIMLRLLPLSTLAILAATFGICGLVLGAVGTGSGATLAGAVIAGVLAGALNSTAFAYLRRSESTTAVGDEQLVGAIGRVVLPVAGGRRGRIAVSVGGQQIYLSAEALSGELPTDAHDEAAALAELEAGTPVLVVEMRRGIASVIKLDPELR